MSKKYWNESEDEDAKAKDSMKPFSSITIYGVPHAAGTIAEESQQHREMKGKEVIVIIREALE